MHTLARTLLFGTVTALAFGLPGGPPLAEAVPVPPGADRRVVFLARGLSDEALTAFGANQVASGKPGLLLLDSDKQSAYLTAFLAAYKPTQVIPVGSYPDGLAELERRLDVRVAPLLSWADEPCERLWRTLFPHADRVVVCPAEPKGQFLQAACLAGSLHAPLWVFHDRPGEGQRLRQRLEAWKTQKLYLVGKVGELESALPSLPAVRLAGEGEVADLYVRRLSTSGPVETIVVANPEERALSTAPLAPLAPWVALQKHAALVLTGPRGTDVDERVRAALRHKALRPVENVLLVANLLGIPVIERPNPITADKDVLIEMEPLTPPGLEAYSFSVGRLFHDDPAVVPLTLARQALLAGARGPRRALVASNAGGGLNLLETFSRNTARELRNAGYETTALFNTEISSDDLRRRLVDQDIFLWEGHHNTLIRDYAFPSWDEPLPPALVFLQSCLALKDYKVQPLLSRGAVAVVGSSTRTYSATGGACSLAFFNGLLYEDQTLGGALRQAKNFLVAYALLKEKRLGPDATRTGANLRSAWAFTLWGDPTLKLPRPPAPDAAVTPVRHEVAGNTVTLALPSEKHERVKTTRYKVQMAANGRLAGLVRKTGEEAQPLVPFLFAEVPLPQARPGKVPVLTSRLPGHDWVFVWDARRRCGYLLVAPPAHEADNELLFHVHWQSGRGETVAAEKSH